jgi:predicted ArsR family transcriptional regulator
VILAWLREHPGHHTVAEVADGVGCARQVAWRHLADLAAKEVIDRWEVAPPHVWVTISAYSYPEDGPRRPRLEGRASDLPDVGRPLFDNWDASLV